MTCKTCDGWIERIDEDDRAPGQELTADSRRRFRSSPYGRDGDAEVVWFMQHFSCDLCGKPMMPSSDQRYVVKLEVYAAHDPAELTDADLDADHMEEVSQILTDAEESASELAPAYKQFRYDLCPECHAKFLRDPLNKEAAQKFHFSEN
jgi:hypothetical protein